MSGGIAQLSLNLGTRSGCVVSITPRPPIPPGKTLCPYYRRLVGPRSRSGWVQKLIRMYGKKRNSKNFIPNQTLSLFNGFSLHVFSSRFAVSFHTLQSLVYPSSSLLPTSSVSRCLVDVLFQ